jgi:multidrug efflux pump subunit AcrA (membrane-fusion protein)
MDNTGYLLRPDMFVDVEFHVSLPPGIAVPVDAVIDSGLHKTVYVETADGGFTPRQVETGWRMGDTVQITKGLEPGERIVVAGNFLLDSESRMELGRPR